jgi:hypothetical protein
MVVFESRCLYDDDGGGGVVVADESEAVDEGQVEQDGL